MGFGNIGWFQILVVLLIVLLVFGTKKIRNLGGDLGGAIRDFRKGVSEDPDAVKSEESESKDEQAENQPKAKPASDSSRSKDA